MINKKSISYNFQAILGKKANRKFLIIESDDWGHVSMPSIDAYQKLKDYGVPVDSCPYSTYDALEDHNDIEILNNFCASFRDINGLPLKVTANFIMANPNFEYIKDSNYLKYRYIDLKETYQRHQGSLATFNSICESFKKGTIIPQLHGREHLQVNHWLGALKDGDMETKFAFNLGVFGHPSEYGKKSGIHFLSAYHINNREDINFIGQSVIEASKLFNETFGYHSKTFIAPRYIWPNDIEPYFSKAGIQTLQGTLVQLSPDFRRDNNKLKKRINWIGKSNSSGLNYLIRNVFFEPTLNPNFSWEKDALKRIDTAFFWGKPAIISMHRLNLMGGFSQLNRSNSLKRLAVLLKAVQEKYPNVQFLSSDEISNVLYAE